MLDQLLAGIADAINPALAMLALLVPWIDLEAAHEKDSPWSFWARTLLGLVVVYSIKFADRLWLDTLFWSPIGIHYSTHTAFAVSITTSLGAINRRWIFFLLPVLVIYAGLMVHLRYHALSDIWTTALMITPSTWLIHQVGRKQRPLNTSSRSALNDLPPRKSG